MVDSTTSPSTVLVTVPLATASTGRHPSGSADASSHPSSPPASAAPEPPSSSPPLPQAHISARRTTPLGSIRTIPVPTSISARSLGPESPRGVAVPASLRANAANLPTCRHATSGGMPGAPRAEIDGGGDSPESEERLTHPWWRTTDLVSGDSQRRGESVGSTELTYPRYGCRVVGGPDHGLWRESDGPELGIGSAPGNELELSDATVSRHHCTIRVDPGGFHLRDLGSTNGTW